MFDPPAILFVHQNFPGQFRHLARHLAVDHGWQVVGLGDAANVQQRPALEGVTIVGYRFTPKKPAGHPYLRGLENQVRRGQAVLRALLKLKQQGFKPWVIVAHPSWGESLFLREAYPEAHIVNYGEFHYALEGADVGFDPEFPAPDVNERCRLRLRNTAHLHALAECDRIWSPSQWQARHIPEAYRAKTAVIHEGIDTRLVAPNSAACFRHGDLTLTEADQVITYVARSLEPYRGFHIFMRALPALLKAHPKAHAVIVGGDEVSYGRAPSDAAHWRAKMLAEVGATLDLGRVHFLGKLPYADYLSLLQVSSVHVYLTYPFVLSWSLLEALAAGCAVVASRTAPVEEVITDGQNGWLVDFFDHVALAERVGECLARPTATEACRQKARQTIVERYDLATRCLPQQVQLLTGHVYGCPSIHSSFERGRFRRHEG